MNRIRNHWEPLTAQKRREIKRQVASRREYGDMRRIRNKLRNPSPDIATIMHGIEKRGRYISKFFNSSHAFVSAYAMARHEIELYQRDYYSDYW